MNTFSFDLLPFLVAPILFNLWLYLGYVIHNPPVLMPPNFNDKIFLAGVIIIPVGFLLSNITIFILRIWFWIIRGCPVRRWRLESIDGDNFEAIARGEVKKQILDIIGPSRDFDANFNLYILAVYTNEKFNKHLQQWFVRRDKVFTTLCNCITALFSAYLLGRLFFGFYDYDFSWLIATFFMAAIFYFNARITRKQLYGLVNFASYRKL